MRLVALLAALAVASSASAAAEPWQPSMAAAVSYASHRHGVIAFAVRTPTRHWSWHGTRVFHSASVLKAMLLVTYLDLPSVRGASAHAERPRAADADDPRLRQRRPPASVLGIVGPDRLRALAYRAGMRRFTPVTGVWGLSLIDAVDQARYFLRIDRLRRNAPPSLCE